MRGPPDPEMRSPADGWNHGRASRKGDLEPEQITEAASDFQAEKLRRLYSFCQATAYTVASLAFAGCPR
jgi:hypothetical protein